MRPLTQRSVALQLESVEGQGTTVRVWLPLVGTDSGNGSAALAV